MPIPPDGYAAVAIVLVVALEWIAPLSLLPDRALLSPLTLIGLIIAIGGLVLEVAAARELARSGTTTRPNGAPAALATSGVFLYSRNPFYVGIIALLAGAFVGFSLDWAVVAIPALWLALDRFVVPFEERRLEAAFGDAWRAYTSATSRWLWR
jgi:protein-S-isoprenylcysteine O-methyltransferase Ste14